MYANVDVTAVNILDAEKRLNYAKKVVDFETAHF
jgi:hypothetical protein